MYDCGVFMLVNALRLLKSDFAPLNLRIPIDCNLWRLIFQALIGRQYVDGPVVTAPAALVSHASDASVAPINQATVSSRASIESLLQAEKEQREENIQWLERMLDDYQSASLSIKAAIEDLNEVIKTLTTALSANQDSLSAVGEKVQVTEGELAKSNRLIQELSQLKIVFGEELLESLPSKEDIARRECQPLHNKVDVYRGAVTGCEAVNITALTVRGSRKRRYNKLKKKREGVL